MDDPAEIEDALTRLFQLQAAELLVEKDLKGILPAPPNPVAEAHCGRPPVAANYGAA